MTITDLIPSKDTVAGLQDIEQQLETRRYKGTFSLIVAVVSSLWGIVSLVLKSPLGKPGPLTGKDVILLAVAAVAACIWVLARYTGVLFKQSKEPFRYTFSMGEFASVPGEKFSVARTSQLTLLRSDLTERLNRRVRRFSLLETAGAGGTAPDGKGVTYPSHFQIDGEYAIREEENEGGKILHFWPRIRIGPESNPFTLAYPVRLAIEGGDDERDANGAVLDLDEYQRLVERVYSSIATEIYKQIEIDLRDKMTLFPTGSLRALARYIEAEDFETSNTIDAYDRALTMYRSSLGELNASWWHKRLRKAGLSHRWLVSLQWTGVSAALEAEAKTRLGYSRCLIYRRLVSEIVGRERNPIFVSRPQLAETIELLRHCYNSFLPDAGQTLPKSPVSLPEEKFKRCVSAMTLARGTIRRPLRRIQLYQQIREELCETFAVAALAHSRLADSGKAKGFLQLAEALATDSAPGRVQLLLLLAKAELEPAPRYKLRYLNQAGALDIESEIVLYRIAYHSDLLARDNDEITPQKVQQLNGKYEAVLRVNPANIASLIGQGYLLWLVDDLDEARAKIRAGIELQNNVRQTFVGDLKYCLAKIEVERAIRENNQPASDKTENAKTIRSLNQAAFHYEEAILADPAVAASNTGVQSMSSNAYYELIDSGMLSAYRRFADRARSLRSVPALGERVADTLISYALNDRGNASLSYYLRFEVSTASDAALRDARQFLEESLRLDPENVMAEYNYFLAVSWASDAASADLLPQLTRALIPKGALLPPAALAAVLSQAGQQASRKLQSISTPESVTAEPRTETFERKQAGSQPGPSPAPQPERDAPEITQSEELRQPVLDFLRNNSSLASFGDYLNPSGIGALLRKIRQLLENDVNWSDFGDREVFALLVLARVWSVLPAEQNACREICTHIRDVYYPEDFDVTQLLLSVTTDQKQRELLNATIDQAIDQSQQYDSKSCFYKMWRLSRCNEKVSAVCEGWPDRFSGNADYEKANLLFQEANESCGNLPALHDSWALVHEYRAQARGGAGVADAEVSRDAIGERREACRLDPGNVDYRGSVLRLRGRQLVTGNVYDDPLEKRTLPSMIEVEIASGSVSGLGFTSNGLDGGLQKKVDAARNGLKMESGFTLPGINFRDNAGFVKGTFRFFIRGVPLPFESLSPAAPQVEQWDEIVKRIAEVATIHAARFYTSQDCYFKLGEREDTKAMQTDADSLSGLTWVLKALLRECVPIADFAAIALEFRRCRGAMRDLLATAEEIRSLPAIRRQLPGNSLALAAGINMDRDLENRLESSIDRGRGEPVLNASPDLRREVHDLASEARSATGSGCAVLLTSPAVRPFVRMLIAANDVSVLSRREIFPGLVARFRESGRA